MNKTPFKAYPCYEPIFTLNSSLHKSKPPALKFHKTIQLIEMKKLFSTLFEMQMRV